MPVPRRENFGYTSERFEFQQTYELIPRRYLRARCFVLVRVEKERLFLGAHLGLPLTKESSTLGFYDVDVQSWYSMKEPETAIQNNADGEKPQPEPLTRVEPSTVTAEQLEELKQRAAKADENWERLLRTTADFDNYKKRANREKQDAIRFANENLLEKLVPVLDSFDMAVAAAQHNKPDSAQSLITGITMVY